MNAATGVARILKAEGVSQVITFPRSGVNNPLGEEGVPLIMMRDERYAAAVADAYSRVSDGHRFGVFTVMGGVNAAGVQMAYGAIAQAFEDATPVLGITDAVPAGGTANTHYDIPMAFKNITKLVGRIDVPHNVPEVMGRAFTHLRTGRPGPVLVQIPRGLGDYDENEHPYTSPKGWRSAADPDDIKAAVKALLAAKSPLIYPGAGVFYADACAELRQFAEMVQAPVLTTLKAKSAFPENHPLSVGVRGEPASHFLQKCDLLFAIGSSISPDRFSHYIPDARHKTIVQCIVDETDLNRTYTAQYAIIGDAKLVLKQLCEEVAAQTGGGRKPNQELLGEIKAAKAKKMAKYGPVMASNDKPINPYRVYADLMKTIDLNNSFVTGDSGNTRDQLSTIYEAVIPHGFLGWGNVSTLGFSLAGATGAKLAFPQRMVVNVTGDAGMGYMIGNFEALIRHGIGVTTIHINNGGFSGYGPGFWGSGHDPYTYSVSDHSTTNTSKALDGLGEHAERVEEPSEIIPALKRAFNENAKGRPAFLEFICSQYPVFGEWLPAGAAAAH